jgi:putative oxidoreductase
MFTDFGSERVRDEVLLIARILLTLLFLTFGWSKLADYSGTVAYMTQTGLALRSLAALVAIVIEFFGAIALILGVWTRPLAILLGLYTLASAFIGHPFWTLSDPAAHYGNMINFFKNVSILGGFLLLYVTGAGRYSVDARLGLAEAPPLRPKAF